MVMEAPLSRSGSARAAARAAEKLAAFSAQTAPVAAVIVPPQPAASPSATITEIPWTRIDIDLYEVARGGYIVGYVEVVGAVFVALGGTRYDRAVEVSQHLTFHAAVDVLVRRGA